MITAALCRAARALIGWRIETLAEESGVDRALLVAFENAAARLDAAQAKAVSAALEAGGALLMPESDGLGAGVRLRFTARDAKQIARLEGEGGIVGEDDVAP